MKPLVRVPAADVPEVVAALRAALAGGSAVWPVDAHTHAADAPDESGTAGAADVLGAGSASGARNPGGDPAAFVDDDIALVVETSGSTDAPKRVVLSAAALRASAEATAARLAGHGHWLLALPAHYIAGAQVLVRSIVAGTRPVTLTGEHFDVAGFAQATARLMREPDGRPRYTSLVPVQLARLVDAAGDEVDHPAAQALRAYEAVLVGGQALPESLWRRADHLGVRVVRTYGSSETSGGCVYDGVALPGVRVRITDDDLVELGGPTLADGYLAEPARTAAAFRVAEDGTRWYRTGDLGELVDGMLRIRGRADDIIISGGVKVALGDIERVLRALPGLADAVVVAVDDPEWGQRAAVASAGASVPLHALAATTDAAGLPPAGRPVRFVHLDALPLLASGKPDRRRIAEQLSATLGGVVE